jgi:hypothetical protein
MTHRRLDGHTSRSSRTANPESWKRSEAEREAEAEVEKAGQEVKNDVDQASRSTNEQSRLAHGGSSGVISSALVELCSLFGRRRPEAKEKEKKMEISWMPLMSTRLTKARTLGGMAAER